MDDDDLSRVPTTDAAAMFLAPHARHRIDMKHSQQIQLTGNDLGVELGGTDEQHARIGKLRQLFDLVMKHDDELKTRGFGWFWT